MTIKNRLALIEAKMNPQPTKNMILKFVIDDGVGDAISDDDGLDDGVTSWEHSNGTIYPTDYDFSHLKGVNVLFANYAD